MALPRLFGGEHSVATAAMRCSKRLLQDYDCRYVRVVREATHCREPAVVLVSMRLCACQAFEPGAVLLLAHHAVKVQLVLSMPQSICNQTFKDILNSAGTCRASNQPCLSARKIMTEGHLSDIIWVQESIVRVGPRPWPIQELVLVLHFRLCSCSQYHERPFFWLL